MVRGQLSGEVRMAEIDADLAHLKRLHADIQAASVFSKVRIAEEIGVVSLEMTERVIGVLRDLVRRAG